MAMMEKLLLKEITASSKIVIGAVEREADFKTASSVIVFHSMKQSFIVYVYIALLLFCQDK